MPLPAESTTEQIAQRIETRLSALVSGASYFYTPERVARSADFDPAWLAGLVGPVYILTTGEERIDEATTGQVSVETEFIVTACKQQEHGQSNPFLIQDEDETGPDTVWNRLTRDVLFALMTDVTMSGLAVNVLGDNGATVQRFTISGGWVCVEIRFTCQSMPLKTTL